MAQVHANEVAGDTHGLNKHLKLRDLIAFGIAAIIGAGIFSTIGQASAQGGPAVIFLFLFTALASGFAAFAYAEFASMVPVAGSAYTYSYVAFGELIAWIIGWALIMEYAIGNITVAISWSDYLTTMLEQIHIQAIGLKGIHLPDWMQMDYLSASKGYSEALQFLKNGGWFKEFRTGTPASARGLVNGSKNWFLAFSSWYSSALYYCADHLVGLPWHQRKPKCIQCNGDH